MWLSFLVLCRSTLSGHQNGSRWSQDCSKMASRAPKRAPGGSKMTPRRPGFRRTHDDPNWTQDGLKRTQAGPKYRRRTQDGPKWLQDGFKRSPKWSTGASKIALSPRHRADFVEFACPFPFCVFLFLRAIKMVQDGPKIAPRWHQERSRGPQGGS